MMTKIVALQLSERAQRIKPSATLAIASRAEELQAMGKTIINLGVGEPDFDTPEHIKEAAIQAIREGHTKYTAVDGIKPLKQAIVNKFLRENRLNYALNQILVSCGAKHSVCNLFLATLNPGDEVIIPAPFWVSYPDIALLAHATPVMIQTTMSQQFKITPAQLEAAITPKTRIILFNSPSNPSGMAYTPSEWKALSEVVLRHPAIIVASDDMYEHNLWNHTPFTNILNICPDLYDRTVIINGVSKAYAMTGWRIGYAAGPATLIAAMKKIQSQSTSNPASISQYAALAALQSNQGFITEMTKAYKARHDFLVGELKTISGFQCIPSDGTFYTFPSIEKLLHPYTKIKDDLEFAEFLLMQAEVAVIPGSAFGTSGYIRMSYATSMDHLVEATKRIRQVIREKI